MCLINFCTPLGGKRMAIPLISFIKTCSSVYQPLHVGFLNTHCNDTLYPYICTLPLLHSPTPISLKSPSDTMRSATAMTMRAVTVAAFGGPEVCELTAAVVPVPGPGQVLVKMEAAGVNPVDTYIRAGTYPLLPPLPYCPGKDGAGRVAQSTETWKEGERVFFTFSPSGVCSEFALADERLCWRLPERLSFEQGAALGVPYFTAYRALLSKYEGSAELPACTAYCLYDADAKPSPARAS